MKIPASVNCDPDIGVKITFTNNNTQFNTNSLPLLKLDYKVTFAKHSKSPLKSGIAIMPNSYIAIGFLGKVQHLAGIFVKQHKASL